MTAAKAVAVRALLEDELSWRLNEVRHLRNLQSTTTSGPIQAIGFALRRALLVMLYAHIEGFTKFALEQYASAINEANISIGDAKNPLVASCLVDKFKTYRSIIVSDPRDPGGNKARQVFKDAEFVEEILTLQRTQIQLDVDRVVSSDSNLSSSVLRRNMALLALDEAEVHKFTSALDGLLQLRNGIAHGERINLKSDPAFVKLEQRVHNLCETLIRVIYQSVRDENYRR